MKFKPGERVRIIRVDPNAQRATRVKPGMQGTIFRHVPEHRWNLLGFTSEPVYEVIVDGFGSQCYDGPESYLEKLKPSGWEKVSWDSMPWKPKELVS